MAGASYRLRTLLAVLGTLLVALFTFYYSRLVCVAICALPSSQLSRNIALISFGHFIAALCAAQSPDYTEWNAAAIASSDCVSTVGDVLAVRRWQIAILLHIVLYPEFPLGSHPSSRWGFGCSAEESSVSWNICCSAKRRRCRRQILGARNFVSGCAGDWSKAMSCLRWLHAGAAADADPGWWESCTASDDMSSKQRCCRWCLRARRSFGGALLLDGACKDSEQLLAWFSKSDKGTSSPP